MDSSNNDITFLVPQAQLTSDVEPGKWSNSNLSASTSSANFGALYVNDIITNMVIVHDIWCKANFKSINYDPVNGYKLNICLNKDTCQEWTGGDHQALSKNAPLYKTRAGIYKGGVTSKENWYLPEVVLKSLQVNMIHNRMNYYKQTVLKHNSS